MVYLVIDLMLVFSLSIVTHVLLRENVKLRRRITAAERSVRANAVAARKSPGFSRKRLSGILTVHRGDQSSSCRATFNTDR